MNNLYRIEKVMDQAQNLDQVPGYNLPGTDGVAMLTSNDGFAFVKLHPVRITAKRALPCYICNDMPALTHMIYQHAGGMGTLYATYCPNCGRLLSREEKEVPTNGGV